MNFEQKLEFVKKLKALDPDSIVELFYMVDALQATVSEIESENE